MVASTVSPTTAPSAHVTAQPSCTVGFEQPTTVDQQAVVVVTDPFDAEYGQPVVPAAQRLEHQALPVSLHAPSRYGQVR
jgi:hypothetical protein